MLVQLEPIWVKFDLGIIVRNRLKSESEVEKTSYVRHRVMKADLNSKL